MSIVFGDNVWVFHAGALGDHVMIWPLVRAMARQGSRVTVVAATSHAKLCETEMGNTLGGSGAGPVIGLCAESAGYTGLWAGRAAGVVEGVGTVLSCTADEASEPGRRWIGAARIMFPGARVWCVGAPGSESRRALWRTARVEEFGDVRTERPGHGAIMLFTGAGGAGKRWSMDRWVLLGARLRDEGIGGTSRLALSAGPVEAERYTPGERERFGRAGGAFLGVDEGPGRLARRIECSRLFIGCDTGPTHLAAQLGVPTIALFGPTDPAVWAPVGPRVRVIAPERLCGMEWLDPERVAGQVREMLAV